jgi:xylulokinase
LTPGHLDKSPLAGYFYIFLKHFNTGRFMGCFLGLDSSTQGLKAVVIDAEKGTLLHSCAVNFGDDLPDFKCPKGVLPNPDPLIAHSDPLMWVAALDLLFERMSKESALMRLIKGVSGSGQQHGSVYLNASAPDILKNLSAKSKLAEQLAPALSRKTSPVWMDSSTSAECAEISKAIGRAALRETTGSAAIERFTGPQIRKFFKTDRKSYEATETIHLVSSFMASVLCGKSAPLDYGDGAGMNLLNLKTLQWDQAIAEATAPGLIKKLPPVVPGGTLAGKLHPYFQRYGFGQDVQVAVWTGDNPSSLVGTGASKFGRAVISLGTSDTFFAAMNTFKTDPDGCGHVFGNPAGGFMCLICFKNGSLAREKVKDECGADWDYFGGAACAETAPGNGGNIMLPYFAPEITPLSTASGAQYTGPAFASGRASSAVKIRAVLEAQALSLRFHSSWMGAHFDAVRLTGGASKCGGFRKILADVFQCVIERISVPDSAALGAAMRAANVCGAVPLDDLYAKFCAPAGEAVKPDPKNKALYDSMLKDYAAFEKKFLNK